MSATRIPRDFTELTGQVSAVQLPATGVAAGTYSAATVTVDTTGRVTAISGSAGLALDSAVVHLAGAETVTGAKTLTAGVAVSAGDPTLVPVTVTVAAGQSVPAFLIQSIGGTPLTWHDGAGVYTVAAPYISATPVVRIKDVFGNVIDWLHAGGSNGQSVYGGGAGNLSSAAGGNVAFGVGTLTNVTSGGVNVALGYFAGPTVTTEDFNVLIGKSADITAGCTSCVVIGNDARATASHQVVLGGTADTVVYSGQLQIPTRADAAAAAGTLYFGSDHADGAGDPRLCRKGPSGAVTVIG